jgi:hypothetical protein
MRSYRPAQTAAPSGNRIRERYLHQLGLQRGVSAPSPLGNPQQNAVVVISGLPSLPEDATTNLQLESHDFSNYPKGGDSEMGDSSHSLDSGSTGKLAQGKEPMTSMALSCPQLVKPQEAKGSTLARWFSKPADGKEDQGSVTSSTTSTTAESSFSAMVSRDWGAASSHNMEEGCVPPANLQGVHFQCGHPRLLNNTGHCAASSLAHALNRFNIDSDCDASVASNSVMGGNNSIMTEEDAMDEDDASVHSHASYMSAGSTSHHRGRRKVGKAQRLLDRAAAHERILQIRNEQSQKTRASLVHAQRMGHQENVETRSRSSSTSSQNSIPLLHVQHGSTVQEGALKPHPQLAYGDLSRTPTASNCSDPRKLLKGLQVPNSLFRPGLNGTAPPGVHVSSNPCPERSNVHAAEALPGKPLQFHPQLASGVPPSSSDATASEEVKSHSVASQDVTALFAHHRQSSVDDVLEVVEALSKLKGRGRSGAIPRFR